MAVLSIQKCEACNFNVIVMFGLQVLPRAKPVAILAVTGAHWFHLLTVKQLTHLQRYFAHLHPLLPLPPAAEMLPAQGDHIYMN